MNQHPQQTTPGPVELTENHTPFVGMRQFHGHNPNTDRDVLQLIISETLVDEELLTFIEGWLARRYPARPALALIPGVGAPRSRARANPFYTPARLELV